jgi:hypothetical protein
MGTNLSKPSLFKAGIAACALAFASGAAMADTAVTLTASPTTTTLPDGQTVAMWGLMCGTVSAGTLTYSAGTDSTDAAATPCTTMAGAAQTGTWQPPRITVPAGQPLTITLIDNLAFATTGSANSVPTSLVIVGQLGGGLGTDRATMPSPVHKPQGTTWPGTLGGTDTSASAITVSSGGSGYTTSSVVTISGGGGTGATAVISAVDVNGAIQAVTVTNGGSGYTSAPTVSVDGGTGAVLAVGLADLQSAGTPTFTPPAQADRVRSFGTEVNVADAGGKALTWNNLRPGTYLIESGTEPSIQGPMGLYGVLVVTEPVGASGAHQAYGTSYDQDVALLFSEIDQVQNTAVDQAVRSAGFSDTLVWNGQAGQCGDPAVHTCYPPAVNYTPLYYLINGVSFDRTNTAASTLAVPAPAAQGRVLLRLVNAGLHMHVPSVVGSKLTLVAEDGNKLPGNPRLQSEVLLTAGKTYDVTIEPSQTVAAGTYDAATYAVFDRALSLSTGNQRDGGMQAYIAVAGGAAGGASSSDSAATLSAGDKTFYCIAGTTLTVSDPSLGLLGGATGANGVVLGTATLGASDSLELHSNGTFTYASPAGSAACGGSFTYLVNGTQSHVATIAQCDATAQGNGCALGAAPQVTDVQFVSNVSTRYASPPPGVLTGVSANPSGQTLTAVGTGLNADGSFVATSSGAACPNTLSPAAPAGATCVTLAYQARNAQGVLSNTANATVVFLPASNLAVNVYDAPSLQPGKTPVAVSDYRWIIEEDRTFWIDPKCQINSTDPALRPSTCPPLPVESLGYSFHTSNMPVVAQGCVGPVSCEAGQTLGGAAAVCDIGNGTCRTDGTTQKAELLPSAVHLDPNKRYFISVLPGDGVNPTIGGAGGPDASGKPFSIATACGSYTGPTGAWEPGGSAALCGHAMGGSQVAAGQTAVSIALQETPLPTAKIAVFVFQDDNPLNGENDAGGGVDVLAPNEPGLGGFNIEIFDQAGGLGDNTGQITYDMFNQPVSNSLAGKIDPITGLDSCPITRRNDGPNGNFVGMIPTCPKYESDGKTPSPLAGQAVIANLYPGLYEISAVAGADRIGAGEEWVQTNTLDGGKPHEAFIKPNEPGYFQEFGPGNFHVSIGFANPKIINQRKTNTAGTGICDPVKIDPATGANVGGSGQTCTSNLTVRVSNNHMSRTPDQRTYSSGNYDHYSFTQCYVSIGPADAQDFAFEKCAPDGTVTFTGVPAGTFKLTVFDQWNDIMLDGLVGTVVVGANGATDTVKDFPVTQWRTNLLTRTYIDANGNGIPDRDASGNDLEAGLALVNTNIRYRDGSFGFFNNTDLNGYAGFNEVFPFMNWLVVETSSTRFKPTGVHTVYDVGGPVDGTTGGGTSAIGASLANTLETIPLPADLRVPGARYCASADCPTGDSAGGSSGVVVPPQPWGVSQGWQGLLGQVSFMEFGMRPFAPNENGGIAGHVIYASTRPFDDPSLSLQLQWEPGVPHVKINLYSKGLDALGNETLTLVDTTTTTSWDDWAQGFRHDAAGNLMKDASGNYIPNMNCPGQDATSPFFTTLKGSKQWLDQSNPKLALADDSQFKCYDGWSQLNQVQPAPYDGMYQFPSVTAVDPATGKPSKTNCTGCTQTDADGNPMLPPGKYVVEVIVPPGYELVKEEDKNILLGDVYIAPVTQQFAGFGNIFIMPDQAAVNSQYNASNPGALNLTADLGSTTFPRHEGDTGSIEAYWPCVGAERIVPDLNSLYPGAQQAAPFAGAKRPLCDRKEVVLQDEGSVLAKFFIFSSTHIAGHFTGTITNDFAAEFDPFSPQFGEKFGPPNLPVGMRDFTGNEVARVYSDQWGIYNGLYFSTYGVNPPNPTGYVPQMAIACMNDPGPIPDPSGAKNADGTPVMITDPAYNPAYSNFCYETAFMPGFTAYMDTPVIPTQSFADGYNLPDSEYPDATPAIRSVVNSDASMPQGPWVTSGSAAKAATVTFTISNVQVNDSVSSLTVGGTQVLAQLNGAPVPLVCNSLLCNLLGFASQTDRNNYIAIAVATSIDLGGSGYVATASGATVAITAPAGTGAELNGTAVAITQTGIDIAPSTLALAGGAAAGPTAMNLTITALGDKVVQNPNFSGPNSTTAPYNQKTITRHYGFGSAAGTVAVLDAAGVSHPLTGVSWSDTQISGTVPGDLPPCSASNPSYQGANAGARCGELVITAANGKQSIDAITVTVDGTAPWIVAPSGVTAPAGRAVADYGANFGRMGTSPIQTAIDSADPGDLILVTPGTYRENLIMWKPVRLQGVGAASVTVNADAHPAGKMDQWRRQVNCAFGLTLDGTPNLNDAGYSGTDPNNSGYSCPAAMHQRVDRIPFEAIVGWDASGNGNLAQVLQEPTLMGAYEGAGITVLGRGVRIPDTSTDFWGQQATGGAGAFTDGSVWLSGSGADCTADPSETDGRDYGTSNFLCNPSRIDGVSIINSSQGGGALFIHGWSHDLEVANTRISGNHGTLAGGINLGNGETPDAFVNNGTECGVSPPVMPCPPIPVATAANAAIPFQFNTGVRIHHNMIYNNASVGDALFSGTPSGAGAITVSAGADDYRIDHNWIAGNLSTGDGGGVQHLGLSFRGNISHNYILFNQSTNPTLPTNGGGVIVEGANLDRMLNGVECGSTNDQDCPPGLGEGAGPGTVIDANLIVGNSAESGSGGGLRLQQVNGSEVVAFPSSGDEPATSGQAWYGVTVTNNIIANNVAGWDGGGVSIQDSMKVNLVNNTVASNDTTASAGVLFKTLGAIYSASPPPGCTPTTDPSLPQNPNCTIDNAQHGPQPAGLVVMEHTPNLLDALTGLSVGCPSATSGYGYAGGDCVKLSKPKMVNNLFWQNRSFSVNIVGQGSGTQSQQNLVALTPLLTQATTGDCPAGANYWDIGVRTDDFGNSTTPGVLYGSTLALTNSIYTGDPQGVITVNASNIVGGSSPVVAAYCNGARMPPEHCSDAGVDQNSPSCKGFNAPPGASETTSVTQLFVFNGIQPTATVDEGHNWLNLSYGPLTLSRPHATAATPGELLVATAAVGVAGGAYSIPNTSPAVGAGTTVAGVTPATDFFGQSRAASGSAIGAVEVVAAPVTGISPTSLDFGSQALGSTTAAPGQAIALSNTGAGSLTVDTTAITVPAGFVRYTGAAGTNMCATSGTITVAAGGSCNLYFQFAPTVVGSVGGNATIPTNDPSHATLTVALSGTGTVPMPSLNLLDQFNRSNSNTLGSNWRELVVFGAAGILVNTNQAYCSSTNARCLGGSAAYWNGSVFGARQAAAFTVGASGSTLNGDSLLLKATPTTSSTPTYFIRVRTTGSTVVVDTTTNAGLSYATAGTLNVTLASGDVLTAMVDASGLVSVWNNAAFVGTVQLPNNSRWTTGTGRIGMQLQRGARVDDFRGGTVP